MACPRCGLPNELCVCETIAKESQRISVGTVRRKFGKLATVVEGFDQSINVRELAKRLKSELACGGTDKGGKVELQGCHAQKVKRLLVKMGFAAETIDVK